MVRVREKHCNQTVTRLAIFKGYVEPMANYLLFLKRQKAPIRPAIATNMSNTAEEVIQMCCWWYCEEVS